jgi:hypothetical protein
MPTGLSSQGDAQSSRYHSNMFRTALTSSVVGVGLTISCLGIGGGCYRPGQAGPRAVSPLYVERLPQCPTICGPCGGYRPTHWMSWSDYCPTCLRSSRGIHATHVSGSDVPPGEGVLAPDGNPEMVPVPQGEPQAGATDVLGSNGPTPGVPKPARAEKRQPRAEGPAETQERRRKVPVPPKAEEPLPGVGKPAKREEPRPTAAAPPKVTRPVTKEIKLESIIAI